MRKYDSDENRKNIIDGIRLNPKYFNNRQSAANFRKEKRSTIILI